MTTDHTAKILTMSKSLQKPNILKVETVSQYRLHNVASVDLEFSIGVRSVYERMR
ncbi:ADP compounds hydrolase NudE, partial [Salmonella enterica subsp. enterica serovar Typhimurium]